MGKPTTINRAALLTPQTWNEETRSGQIVISTEADVGDGIILQHNRSAIRWPDRPMPADIDHLMTSASVWGAVTDLAIERGADGTNQLVGRVVVDGPEDAMGVALPRLRTGSARFSVTARVYDAKRQGDQLVATDWEPQLVSLVARPQDSSAVMRGDTQLPGETSMTTETAGSDPVTTTAETAPSAAPAVAVAEPLASVADETVERSAAETRRELEIIRAGLEAGLDAGTVQRILTETSGQPIARAFTAVVTALKTRQEAGQPSSIGHPAQMKITRDEGDTLMRAFSDELERRIGIIQAPTEVGKQAFQMSTLEMCRGYLQRNGVNTAGMSKDELVVRSMNGADDFPLLFAAVVNKRLLAAYEAEPQTWKDLAVQRDLPDFKLVNDLQVSGKALPEKLTESGEYPLRTLVEGKASWSIDTYGERFLFSRKAMINDDLGALQRVPDIAGRGCRQMENNMVWALITGNATVSLDGLPLFDSSHKNVLPSGADSVIGIKGLNAASVLMQLQQDIAANDIDVSPVYLLVPVGMEYIANQVLYPNLYSPTQLTGASGVNPFAGKLQIIKDKRLDRDNPTQWYLASSPNNVEMIKYGYLAGQPGPFLQTNTQRNPDGMELLVRMDFGCSLGDYRGFVRSPGA